MSLSAYGKLPIPRMTPELLRLVKTGEVFSLGIDFQEGMLTPGAAMKSYSIVPHLRHSDPSAINPGTAAAEVIRMSIHVGTHIDALCHISEKQDAQGNPARMASRDFMPAMIRQWRPANALQRRDSSTWQSRRCRRS